MASNKPDPAAISTETATHLLEEFIHLEEIDMLPMKKAINILDEEELLKLKARLRQLSTHINNLRYKQSDRGMDNYEKQLERRRKKPE